MEYLLKLGCAWGTGAHFLFTLAEKGGGGGGGALSEPDHSAPAATPLASVPSRTDTSTCAARGSVRE